MDTGTAEILVSGGVWGSGHFQGRVGVGVGHAWERLLQESVTTTRASACRVPVTDLECSPR